MLLGGEQAGVLPALAVGVAVLPLLAWPMAALSFCTTVLCCHSLGFPM
jgi:hypothetical protein